MHSNSVFLIITDPEWFTKVLNILHSGPTNVDDVPFLTSKSVAYIL